jgi:flavin reductase (DIM6/NTAB) family NADH-FMN oxidoreductase RutF
VGPVAIKLCFVQGLPCVRARVTSWGRAITSHHGAETGAIDTAEFRRTLGHFVTGVTVVSYAPADGSEFRGTTVNSFTSVSLEPPLVLVSLSKTSRSSAAIKPGVPYAVNVLHHGQRDLAMHFAGRPKPETRVDWEVRAGVPHLAEAGAFFRCVARDVHDAGDHVLVVGLVEEFQAHGHPPLLFYRGTFEHLRDAAAEPDADREFYFDFPELW